MSVGAIKLPVGARKGIRLIVPWIFCAVLLIGIWLLLDAHISPAFWSSPRHVWDTITMWFSDGKLGSIIWTTMSESLAGYGIGALIGLLVGLGIALAPFLVGKVFEPVVTAVYAMPNLALAPFLFLALGGAFESRTLLVVLAVFPTVAIFTISGIRTVDPDAARMLQFFGASRRQVGRLLMLPHTASYVIAAMLFVAPYAITIAIGAEILFGATNGLGGTLDNATQTYQAASVLATLVVSSLLSCVLVAGTRKIGARLMANREVVGAEQLKA